MSAGHHFDEHDLARTSNSSLYVRALVQVEERPCDGMPRTLIQQLKADGIGIFLVSRDVFDLADRINVMLHGKLVGTVNTM
jgi:hypothetical protein